MFVKVNRALSDDDNLFSKLSKKITSDDLDVQERMINQIGTQKEIKSQKNQLKSPRILRISYPDQEDLVRCHYVHPSLCIFVSMTC